MLSIQGLSPSCLKDGSLDSLGAKDQLTLVHL